MKTSRGIAKGVVPIVVWIGVDVVSWIVRRGTAKSWVSRLLAVLVDEVTISTYD